MLVKSVQLEYVRPTGPPARVPKSLLLKTARASVTKMSSLDLSSSQMMINDSDTSAILFQRNKREITPGGSREVGFFPGSDMRAGYPVSRTVESVQLDVL